MYERKVGGELTSADSVEKWRLRGGRWGSHAPFSVSFTLPLWFGSVE